MIDRTVQGAELIQNRIKQAFGYIVLFRDMPVGVIQEYDYTGIYNHSITYITRGRAEFYLDGQPIEDRVEGMLSTERTPIPGSQDKIFRLVVVEDHRRTCIASPPNKSLPTVTKLELADGATHLFPVGYRGLVCEGALNFASKQIPMESPFTIVDQAKTATAQGKTFILDFTNA